MIGQRELIKQISRQWELGRFPQFAIFVGPRGCGKKELIKKIVRENDLMLTEVPTTVDGVRDLISFVSTVGNALCSIYNIDSLSEAGCNALLKVAEEPPKGTYIITTCENINNVPTTIRSRAVVYQFEEYTEDDKLDFCEERGYEATNFVFSISETLGDIEVLNSYDIQAFQDFVELVINNISSVSGANAFKIANRICIKGDEGYDLMLFLRAFKDTCLEYALKKDTNCLKFSRAVTITGEILDELRDKSKNKQMLFDTWLLNVRSAWA